MDYNNEPNQNDLSNLSLLNTSINKSCAYSPILNEIFHYRILKNNTKIIFYNLIASIFTCLLFLILFCNHEYLFDSYFGLIIQSKTKQFQSIANLSVKFVFFSLFLLFLCNIIYNVYNLLSNLFIHGNLDVQKTIDLSKKQKVLTPKETKSLKIEESPINLPFFSLSPKQTSKVQFIPNQYQHHEKSPLSFSKTTIQHRSLDESIGLSSGQLNKFMHDLDTQEEESIRLPYGETNFMLANSTNRFLSYQQKLFSDKTIELRNNQYQIGLRSPTKTDQSVSPIKRQSSLLKTDELKTEVSEDQIKKIGEDKKLSPMSASIERDSWCKSYGITRIKLDLMRENLRKWIALTILKPLIKEISKINDQLTQIGCFDLRIGKASISQLNAFMQTPKANLYPTLKVLLPYLEITSNQEYLVQRLIELAHTGCLSEFDWNKGGSFKLKEWGDFLPTDSNIIMHIFCTYMNSKLLPHAVYSYSKPFTNQYFKRNELVMSSEPASSTDSLQGLIKAEPKVELTQDIINKQQSQQTQHHHSLYIFEAKMNPPHYNVVHSGQIYEISLGRNNLFDALLCFLYIIKMEFRGMLGLISLDSNGLNILNVLE